MCVRCMYEYYFFFENTVVYELLIYFQDKLYMYMYGIDSGLRRVTGLVVLPVFVVK